MIKANDLRPGNIIRHTVHGVITIEGVWSQKVKDGNYETVYHNKEWHLLGHCKPIELKPELLGKIKGIEKSIHGDGYDYVTDYWTLSIDIKSGRISVVTSRECEYFASDAAKYLHRLQNLVYDLSGGTELSITL